MTDAKTPPGTGAVSRPMAAWRTRRKMYASASPISAGPGLRSTIIAFLSSDMGVG